MKSSEFALIKKGTSVLFIIVLFITLTFFGCAQKTDKKEKELVVYKPVATSTTPEPSSSMLLIGAAAAGLTAYLFKRLRSR